MRLSFSNAFHLILLVFSHGLFANVFAYCIFQVVWLICSLVLFDAFPSWQRLCSLVTELQEVNDLERKRKKIRGGGGIDSSANELEHKEASVLSSEIPDNAAGGDGEEGDESQMTEVGDEEEGDGDRGVEGDESQVEGGELEANVIMDEGVAKEEENASLFSTQEVELDCGGGYPADATSVAPVVEPNTAPASAKEVSLVERCYDACYQC